MLEKLQVGSKVYIKGLLCNQKFRVHKLCAAADLVITNTYFTKRDSQLLTYRSGNACSQIDYILVRKRNFKSVRNVNVIGSKKCVKKCVIAYHENKNYGSCQTQ